MRDRWSAVKHRLDGWHLGKGNLAYIDKTNHTHIHTLFQRSYAIFQVQKKRLIPLQKKQRLSRCSKVEEEHCQSHALMSASSNDDADLKEAKWLSITNHIMDKHS